MDEIALLTLSSAALEYDLTLLEPPAQVQLVDQATELLTREVKVVH